MAIELIIQSGPKAPPETRRFEEPFVTIGRDPSSLLCFDMETDLEVSTRHAEIRYEMGTYVIADKDSTNGTWVNGGRLSGTRSLNPGDVINLGRSGPELRVSMVDDRVWHKTVENRVRLPPLNTHPEWRPRRTREWIVTVMQAQNRTLKLTVAGLILGGAVLMLAGALYIRRLGGEDERVWREVTAPAIRRANDAAVALIETEIPGSACQRGCEGTGFSITPEGHIVTNRHVVWQQGRPATRIRVKFANTRIWHEASLVRAAADPSVDVAVIRVTGRGPYPAIVGVSARGADLPEGSAVIVVGFPLGTALRMEGEGAAAIARTTMTLGSIGKVMSDLVQIDALADHGSSGSPVFDRHGHGIGVVSGGAKSQDRIVYVVPASRIREVVASAGIVLPQ